MKRILVLVLLLSSLAAAKDRAWQEATLIEMRSEKNDAGAVIMPVGTTMIGVPVSEELHYYSFKTPTMTYVAVRRRKMLNLVVNRKAKIALEGSKLYALDDDGKEVKLNLVQRIAPPEAEPEKKP